MRYALLILCLPLLAVGAAEEAVPVAVAAGDNSLVTIITSVLGLVLAWGFKLLREKWKIDGEKAALDATKSLWEQRNFLIDNRIIPFAISTAEHWMLTQLPAIIADATDGNGFAWSKHWDGLKAYTKQRVVAKFAAENVDVVTLLGEKELDYLLDRLLLKLVAQLPESVQKFLPPAFLDRLTDLASRFAVDKGRALLGLEAH